MVSPAERLTPTERTKLKRRRHLGSHDRATIHAILDEALTCHVGYVVNGEPVVTPCSHVRDGDRLLFHGSVGSRTLRAMRSGQPICVSVSIVDGLVFARAAFNQDINYRSVMLFGTASEIKEKEAKTEALRILVEGLIPGRWNDVRPPTDRELKQTMVVEMPIEEASAKIRSGQVEDEEDDYAYPAWAGVVPLRLTAGKPETDPRCDPSFSPPAYARSYTRG